MKGKTIALIILGIFLLFACCAITGVVGWAVYKNTQEDEPTPWPSNTSDTDVSDTDTDTDTTPTPTPTDDTDTTPENATIEGSLSYPSEYIPSNLTICAESLSGENYCTSDHITDSAFTYGEGYELSVPAGSYYVYAYDPDGDPTYTAYYSEFVTCGLSVDCPSHEHILVTVSSGETATSIDPGDWYDF